MTGLNIAGGGEQCAHTSDGIPTWEAVFEDLLVVVVTHARTEQLRGRAVNRGRRVDDWVMQRFACSEVYI